MKILVAAFAYNEIKYISEMVNYYRNQGCYLNIIDNCSTDGTFEWMRNNGVQTRKINTGGTFDLLKLQKFLLSDIRAHKPDWVVYAGIDIIYSFWRTIRKTIESADRMGYNIIGVQHYNLYNTGEEYKQPLYKNYFHGRKGNKLFMIAKYSEPFGFEADSIQLKNRKIYYANGLLLNYGNCKPASERTDTFKRREKAWNNGLDRNYGVHYLEGMQRGWIWPKEELIDMRTIEDYKYIKKIKI